MEMKISMSACTFFTLWWTLDWPNKWVGEGKIVNMYLNAAFTSELGGKENMKSFLVVSPLHGFTAETIVSMAIVGSYCGSLF